MLPPRPLSALCLGVSLLWALLPVKPVFRGFHVSPVSAQRHGAVKVVLEEHVSSVLLSVAE